MPNYFPKSSVPEITWNTQGTKGYVAYEEYTFTYRVNEENPDEGTYDAFMPMGLNLYIVGFDELEVSIIFTPINP